MAVTWFFLEYLIPSLPPPKKKYCGCNQMRNTHNEPSGNLCKVYATIRDETGTNRRSTTVCGSTERETSVFLSNTNTVEVRMIATPNGESNFMLQLQRYPDREGKISNSFVCLSIFRAIEAASSFFIVCWIFSCWVLGHWSSWQWMGESWCWNCCCWLQHFWCFLATNMWRFGLDRRDGFLSGSSNRTGWDPQNKRTTVLLSVRGLKKQKKEKLDKALLLT